MQWGSRKITALDGEGFGGDVIGRVLPIFDEYVRFNSSYMPTSASADVMDAWRGRFSAMVHVFARFFQLG